ncbi:MAG: hypothetical protein ACRDPY_29430 [Streptosporangiaceae bacterium]
MVGLDTELGEFLTVGVGFAFGSFGPGAQVGTQLVAVADGVGSESGQHRLRVGADPAGLGLGSVGGGLRPGSVLLGQPGGPVCLCGLREGQVPGLPGGADRSLACTIAVACSCSAAAIRASASAWADWMAASRSASAWIRAASAWSARA